MKEFYHLSGLKRVIFEAVITETCQGSPYLPSLYPLLPVTPDWFATRLGGLLLA
jgi:hypothetical protein